MIFVVEEVKLMMMEVEVMKLVMVVEVEIVARKVPGRRKRERGWKEVQLE